jgi:hypothetical protein
VPQRKNRNTQVGDEQQLPWPTATMRWTTEFSDQSAFDQVRDSPIQRRTIAGSRKRRNICDRRKR